jgi:hypothetical protein
MPAQCLWQGICRSYQRRGGCRSADEVECLGLASRCNHIILTESIGVECSKPHPRAFCKCSRPHTAPRNPAYTSRKIPSKTSSPKPSWVAHDQDPAPGRPSLRYKLHRRVPDFGRNKRAPAARFCVSRVTREFECRPNSFWNM